MNSGFRLWPSKPPAPTDLNWIQAYNQKAFELLRSQLMSWQATNNFLISPIVTLRDSAVQGSRDVFASEFVPPENQIYVLNHLKKLFLQSEAHQAEVKLEEFLWRNASAEGDPLKIQGKAYKVESKRSHFSEIPRKLNRWLKKHVTPNPSFSFPSSASAFYMSVLSYSGHWMDHFTASEISTFKAAAGEQRAAMMKNSGYYGFLHEEDFEAVDLRYGDGKLSLVIFLPSAESSMHDFIQKLNLENWDSWKKGFLERPGDVQIPQFEIRAKTEGRESRYWLTLQVGPQGNLPQRQYNITEVVGDLDRFRFHADRPFFFAVVDNETDAIWLMGILSSANIS